jgi:hypothetical protein
VEFGMSEMEKEHFAFILDAIKNDKIGSFPSLVIDSIGDGLTKLAGDLIISGFLD